ncbi:MAG TPA: flagellar filament capping protein FliD [Burkholderiales bacterium]|nr:flagellar filament capping protein FliD [Burkholderiales bacterium]
MAISSPGLGSGLDINSIVTQLMTLERRSITALDSKEAKYQAQLTAYGSLKGALSTFQTAVAALATPSKFNTVRTSVADSSVAALTSSTATPGTYSLEVQTLAKAHKLKSPSFAATSMTVGTGKLTISFGTYNLDTFTLNPDKASKEITIGAAQGSLAGIRDAINAANAGVTASIVNDGSGYRLTVSSNDTGVANALRITVADDDASHTDLAGLSQLHYDGRTPSGVQNLTQTVGAQNATAIIDGILVSKASNTFTDVIEGATLTLLKENTPSTTTLSITRDTANVQASVQAFLKAYNDLHKTITDLSKYDSATKKASTLTGDSALRSVQTQLRTAFNKALSTAGGGLTALADIGITFQTDGTLKLDTTKLTTALNDTTKDVSTLFAAVGKPTDSLISFVTSTADTKNGDYAITVDQLATQGKAVGGAAAALTINAASNDTLSLTVDGVAATVTLAAGVYTAASLAAEVQSKINGASALSAAGVKVTVTQSAGVMTVTSNRYGSASIVTLTGGTAQADLFGAHTETAGVDVAGSIGGVAATGSGQMLTGKGDALGLAISVTGGAATTRGTIKFARGYAYELEKLVGKILENDSVVDSRVDGLNASIKDLATRREIMERRLITIESRHRAQFTALDVAISRMQGTSNYLTQQLANLSKLNEQ